MTLLSNYRTTGIRWTRFRKGPKLPPRRNLTIVRKYHVHIDGGFVGDILADDKQQARERAILYYNITQDQKILLTWDHEDEA